MRKFLLPAALLVTLAGGSAVAMADSSPAKMAAAGTMSVTQVTNKLQAQGYTVNKIKYDDGRYKVKATDAAGHKEKLSVNPTTGDVISKDSD